MNILFVYAHPNPKSFNKAILNRAEKNALAKGHDVRIRDLYALGFDPVLAPADFVAMQSGTQRDDVLVEQKHVAWADLIVFIFPNWWYSMPAILKGYVDRVLSFGFAYKDVDGESVGLLTGKKAVVVTTNGATVEELKEQGTIEALKTSISQGIFNFCGIEVLDHIYYGDVRNASDADLDAYLEDFGERCRQLLAD